MINRSESQLIAREQRNQVLKSARQAAERKPVRTDAPKRERRSS